MSIRKARQLPTWRKALRALLLATSLSPIPGSAEARDTVLRIGWDSKHPTTTWPMAQLFALRAERGSRKEM